jgi:hypothetical protein
MSIEARIDTIDRRLRTLKKRLIESGFEFDCDEEALPGPDPDSAEMIDEIENEAGIIPVSLKLFWLRVGSVNFCGSHPEWQLDSASEGEAYPDPLVIEPLAAAVGELEEFLADKEERLRCNHPYVIPIAPDFYHKADVSGGMFYNISVPAVADDPPLNDEWHKTTFLNYLEIAVKWAGFPGLERCPGHTWPIAKLVEGL